MFILKLLGQTELNNFITIYIFGFFVQKLKILKFELKKTKHYLL
jgi:hypothetical protein